MNNAIKLNISTANKFYFAPEKLFKYNLPSIKSKSIL